MTKIKSYKIEGKFIKIITDYEPMPEFIFFKDRYKCKEHLIREINKKITQLEDNKFKDELITSNLKKELDKK